MTCMFPAPEGHRHKALRFSAGKVAIPSLRKPRRGAGGFGVYVCLRPSGAF